jgi:hypothetical protein
MLITSPFDMVSVSEGETQKVGFVEGGTMRGTTALVYSVIHSSLYCIQQLYKGDTVCPTGLTVSQGCNQASTGLPPSSAVGRDEERSEV